MNRVKKMMKAREAGSLLFLALLILLVGLVNKRFLAACQSAELFERFRRIHSSGGRNCFCDSDGRD